MKQVHEYEKGQKRKEFLEYPIIVQFSIYKLSVQINTTLVCLTWKQKYSLDVV